MMHFRKAKAEKAPGARRRMRRVVCIVAAVYALILLAATVYSQTGYVERLPAVALAKIENGMVLRKSMTRDTSGTYTMYTVVRERGPWGMRYIVRQTIIKDYEPGDNRCIYVPIAESIREPLAVPLSANQPLYDGMEVRIVDGTPVWTEDVEAGAEPTAEP